MPLLDTTVTFSITGGETKSLGGVLAQFPDVNPLLLDQVTLANGTGSVSAQKIGLTSFSLTGGASVTLDLRAFAGPFGTCVFTSGKYVVIDNQSTNPADLLQFGDDGTVTNPFTAPFGASARVAIAFPGTPHPLAAPLGGMLIDATHRNLKLTNLNSGTNALTGNVIVIGEGS